MRAVICSSWMSFRTQPITLEANTHDSTCVRRSAVTTCVNMGDPLCDMVFLVEATVHLKERESRQQCCSFKAPTRCITASFTPIFVMCVFAAGSDLGLRQNLRNL